MYILADRNGAYIEAPLRRRKVRMQYTERRAIESKFAMHLPAFSFRRLAAVSNLNQILQKGDSMKLHPVILCAPLCFSAATFASSASLDDETLEAVVEWTVPEDIGCAYYNYNNTSSPVHTFNGYTYAVFTDKNWCPRIAKIKDGDAQIEKLADDYEAMVDGHNTFSIGLDKNGYIHVAGDMHGFPFGSDNTNHYSDYYIAATCLYWVSDNPEDISSFTFYGRDSARVIPGSGHTYQYFLYDREGDLYSSSRQWVRNDPHWTFNPGKVATGLARYDVATKTWTALGGEAPIFEFTDPMSVTHLWEPNHNKVIFWEPTGVDSTPYQTWHTDIYFDENNRLHLATGMNTDNSGNGSHPGAGTAICYAYSDDKGETWHKANGIGIDSLPMRSATADIVAGGHWYIMEAGVTVSPRGKPVVAYRYTPDGNTTVSKWREFGESSWKEEYALPRFYRRAKPRVDCKGVLTVLNGENCYRTLDYAREGVETLGLPYDFFALDQGYFLETGKFRNSAKVRVRSNLDVFGIVRLDITPDTPIVVGTKPDSRRLPRLAAPTPVALHYDLQGRRIEAAASRECPTSGSNVHIVADGNGFIKKTFLRKE